MDKGKHPRLFHLFNAFEVGGVERQHLMLVERLNADFDQICWAYRPGAIQDGLNELGVVNKVGGVELLKKMLEEEDIDCFIVRTNRYLKEVVPLLTSHPAPVVYTRNYLRWFDGNSRHFDRKLDTLAISMADHVFFSGPCLKTPCMALDIHIPGGEIIYNALALDNFPMKPRSLTKKRSLQVVMLANIAPRKNHKAAIEALHSELVSGEIELHLGGVEQFPSCADEVRRAAEGLPMFFHGYIANAAAFLNNYDVLLMTSISEGWPNAIMEGFACGLPAIVPGIG
jgi:glycosyltransferase involved in cell wall biosynthesis